MFKLICTSLSIASIAIFVPVAMADCDFVIINYTDSAVTAKAGFYGKVESSTLVKPATTEILRIKSDYACNSATIIGTGRAYINFPKDSSGAGVNYSPINDSVNFMGKFSGDAAGRPMQADDGTPLWLNAAGHPVTDERMEVKLNFTQRQNSRVSGTP